VNVNEIALMMSIALRFIPTLFEEIDRIMKSQTSRGVDFNYGKYSEKLKALSSIIVPLFISCFQRADDLTDAMIVKGYGMGPRSRYKRLKLGYRDAISLVALIGFISLIIIVNGVI
jgi:energy-coupling factor transport system permease protein